MKLGASARKAVAIGTLCSVSYLAVYIARNILGAVSAQMVDMGVFTAEYSGLLSGIYFYCYAAGQLINGAIGDRIKAKYMISFGLLFAGISNFIFSLLVSDFGNIALVVYGMLGFFLAMIYGPMTKVVAENTEPHHATRCSLGYTFASFFGSPMAGMLAMVFIWQDVYTVSSVALAVMAVTCFCCFLLFERRGMVKYNQYRHTEQSRAGVKILITRYAFLKFAFVSILTGVIRTSGVHFLTQYFHYALGYSTEEAPGIFAIATLCISCTTFISVFVYERLGRNMNLTMLIMFSSSVVFFTATIFTTQPVVHIVFLVVAIMSSNGAATMLWSRYCPSLRDTGMVSGATGFLDFLSYMSAGSFNILFPAVLAPAFSWNCMPIVFLGIVLCGTLLSLPYKAIFRRGEQW